MIGSPDPGPVGDAIQKVYKNDSLQREMPMEPPQKTYRVKRYERQRPPKREPSGGWAISSIFLWALTFIGLALALVWLLREYVGYVPNAVAEAVADPSRSPSENQKVIAASLQDAQDLAQRGEFGPAIHSLLLRTLMELSKAGRHRLPPSLTSREILRSLQLPATEHDALNGLIQAVEHCHFRGTDVDRSDYERCLQHFNVFARAYTGSGQRDRGAA